MTHFRHTAVVRPHSRLRLRVLTGIAVVTTGITAFAGTAQAAPSLDKTTLDLAHTATSVSVTVHNGSIEADNGQLTIRNAAGAEKFRMPLSYNKEYEKYPIAATVSGNTATLIPSRSKAQASELVPAEVDNVRVVAAKQYLAAGPQTKKERDDQALARFNQELSAGMSISSIVGTTLGAVIGGLFGCAATIWIICVPGLITGASIGGIAGLALGGGGSVIVAAVNYFNTINSPFKPPRR